MKLSRSLPAALASLAATSLAGCGGGGPTSFPPVVAGGAAIGPSPRPAINTTWPFLRAAVEAGRPLAGASHLLPNAKNGSLLYVSLGGSASVNIYGIPAWNPLGSLLGFSGASSLCVDALANVYVTDPQADRLSEYAHGSVAPIRRLRDRQGRPFSCAVDPKTGNLAVANLASSGGTANVIVYKAAKGVPTDYTAPNMSNYFFVGYDPSGNLFVDGLDPSGNVTLAELPSGKAAFKPIAMNETLVYPGGVAWDGQYLAVADQIVNVIYQFKVSGSGATSQGSTTLGGAVEVTQFSLTGDTPKHPQATAVVGVDIGGNAVLRWNYPSGGMPTKTLSNLSQPDGIAISK